LALSKAKIGDFHFHDLRTPSPRDSSTKRRSQDPTTNGPYVSNLDAARRAPLLGKFAEWDGSRRVG
jgi:hypothetical protein